MSQLQTPATIEMGGYGMNPANNTHMTGDLDLTDLAVAKSLGLRENLAGLEGKRTVEPSETGQNMSRLLRQAMDTQPDRPHDYSHPGAERNFDAFETSKEELVMGGDNSTINANLLNGENDNVQDHFEVDRPPIASAVRMSDRFKENTGSEIRQRGVW